jgi:hypothetical protein
MSIPLSLSVGQVVERNALPSRFHGQCGQVAGEGTIAACFYTCDRYPEDAASTALFSGEPVDIQWQVEGGYKSGTLVQVSDQSLSPHQSLRNAMLNKCARTTTVASRAESHCTHGTVCTFYTVRVGVLHLRMVDCMCLVAWRRAKEARIRRVEPSFVRTHARCAMYRSFQLSRPVAATGFEGVACLFTARVV